MFVNFVGVALDSVMNEGAFLRYMLGGQVQVPMVLKTAIGATASNPPNGGGSAAQHFRQHVLHLCADSGLEVCGAVGRVHLQRPADRGDPR